MRWDYANLDPVDTRVVEMTVQAEAGFNGFISNESYQVSSAQVATPVAGEPVIVEVVPRYHYHLPWITVFR